MIPAKPFYLIRHAESEANAAGIAAGGELDSPLTDRGREQARSLSHFMTTIEPAPVRLYHSPMTRVKETANLVAEALSLEFEEWEDLREHKLGDWNGRDWEEVLPKLEAKDDPPGGEKEDVFVQRVRNVFSEILEKEQEGIPLIVAHGGIFHALGFMYQYAITPIQNCHLHFFHPAPENKPFPWIVWQYDLQSDGVFRKSAPFCPTSDDPMIDRKTTFDKIIEANRNRHKDAG